MTLVNYMHLMHDLHATFYHARPRANNTELNQCQQLSSSVCYRYPYEHTHLPHAILMPT